MCRFGLPTAGRQMPTPGQCLIHSCRNRFPLACRSESHLTERLDPGCCPATTNSRSSLRAPSIGTVATHCKGIRMQKQSVAKYTVSAPPLLPANLAQGTLLPQRPFAHISTSHIIAHFRGIFAALSASGDARGRRPRVTYVCA